MDSIRTDGIDGIGMGSVVMDDTGCRFPGYRGRHEFQLSPRIGMSIFLLVCVWGE